MNPTARLLAVLLASPFLILVMHALLARSARELPPQIGAALAPVFTCAPVLLLAFAALGNAPEKAAGLLYALLVYGSIGYAYFHIFNMSETARRIRIMREIDKAGSLSEEQILRLYGASDVVGVRLGRLTSTGQLEKRGERYLLKGKVVYGIARVIEAWRGVLGFKPPGKP